MNETRHPRSRGGGRIRGAYTLSWSNSCSDLHVYAATLPHAACAQCAQRGKREMNDAKRIRSVSFRLTDEEYGEIEKAAVAAGDEPNNWCRQLALTAAREGPLFGKTGRLIYTELAVLRFLIGNGLRILFNRNEGEAAAWTRYTAQADQRADEIVAELLSRRK